MSHELDSKRKTRRRKSRKLTPEGLERAALAYLGRFAASEESLRRVLHRRIARSAAAHPIDPEEARGWAEALIVRFRRAGLIDDEAYARARAESMHRRGLGRRGIAVKLRQKGVPAETVARALEVLEEETDGPTELTAAVNYARRRRIGPWRTGEREPFRDRDLAALARQGFDYDTARKIVEAASPDALEDLSAG